MRLNIRNFSTHLFSTIGPALFLFTLFIPSKAVFAGTCDIYPKIPLEVSVGTAVSAGSLVEYLILVYKFIVGSIGLVAAVMIMFWGLRWASAAGNQGIIGKAKEGLESAFAGLIIALASFLILNAINSNLTVFPDICPTGFNFVSTETPPSEVNERCNPSNGNKDCKDGLICVASSASVGSCQTPAAAARPVGNVCSEDSECTTGICNSGTPRACSAGKGTAEPSGGGGTTIYICIDNNDCAAGYLCKTDTVHFAGANKSCQAAVAGDSCDEDSQTSCSGSSPITLFCVDPSIIEFPKCYTGLANQPCENFSDCRQDQGYTCKNSKCSL